MFSEHDHDYSGAGRRSLIAALVLLVHMTVDVVGGVLAGNLSLLAHAGHMVTDAGALMVALAGTMAVCRPQRSGRLACAGWKVLAALFNVLLMWTVASSILLQVFEIVGHGHAHSHEHLGIYLLAVGVIALVIQLASLSSCTVQCTTASVWKGPFAMFRSTRWNRWPSSSQAFWWNCSIGTSRTGP